MSNATGNAVSLLSSSKNGLRYLTANDWALIADKANTAAFRKGDVMVHKGRKTDGVYLLLKGRAKVKFPSQPAPRTIGPGEICGEMSFLDDQPASADVIAEDAVEAFHLDRATLQSLFELFPHLASRFYRSLAASLSQRLRALVEAAPSPSKG